MSRYFYKSTKSKIKEISSINYKRKKPTNGSAIVAESRIVPACVRNDI
jgi:hypothetical protein